jgi:hypothetical protein
LWIFRKVRWLFVLGLRKVRWLKAEEEYEDVAVSWRRFGRRFVEMVGCARAET